MLVNVLAPFATALALSLALVPACRRLGLRYGYVAYPTDDRWHRRPVPLLGGVAIFAAVALGLLILPGGLDRPVLAGCAALMFGLGLIDDGRALNATTKLVVQFVVAAGLVFLGEGLHWTGSATADAVLTVLWVVGITNAVNLIDNIDGLCAGVTLVAGAAWLAILLTGDPAAAGSGEVSYLALLLGAVAGFLVYNRAPASIFMGDAGTFFLGASLAGLTLGAGGDAAPGQPAPFAVVAAPLLVLLVPLLDTALVTGTRLLDARSVVHGGRDHVSHRLVAIGLSERRAVAVLWALATLAGAAGWAVSTLDASWSILLAATALIGAVVLGAYLAHVDVAGRSAAGDAPPLWSPAAAPDGERYAGVGRSAAVLLDFFLISVAYYAAYLLRFEGAVVAGDFSRFLQSLPIVMACQLVALWVAGAYRGTWWRFGLLDAAPLVKAAVGGTVAAQMVILYLYRFTFYSRTVFIIDGLLLLLALLATRVSFRFLGVLVERNRRDGGCLALYGVAERDGAALREFLATSPKRYRVLGFVDDRPGLGRRLLGYPVLGDRERLLDMIRARRVDVVTIGSEQAACTPIEELRETCAAHGVRLVRVEMAIVDLTPVEGAAQDRSKSPTVSRTSVLIDPPSNS
ncbi:MAG: hypothetical protein OXG72_14455 [Acidobacteria bacterium]|nr:hypothetical protein [Acidobacteriota bacterium]